MSSPYTFLALVGFLSWSAGDDDGPQCGNNWRWPGWPPRRGQGDPQGDPWVITFLGNLYYGSVAFLTVITAVTHQEHAFSLPYGPLLFVPALRVLAGLYANNLLAPAATKAKMCRHQPVNASRTVARLTIIIRTRWDIIRRGRGLAISAQNVRVIIDPILYDGGGRNSIVK
jgi:hypothetical protein